MVLERNLAIVPDPLCSIVTRTFFSVSRGRHVTRTFFSVNRGRHVSRKWSENEQYKRHGGRIGRGGIGEMEMERRAYEKEIGGRYSTLKK